MDLLCSMATGDRIVGGGPPGRYGLAREELAQLSALDRGSVALRATGERVRWLPRLWNDGDGPLEYSRGTRLTLSSCSSSNDSLLRLFRLVGECTYSGGVMVPGGPAIGDVVDD